MGRRAGVSAEETRAQLLDAASRVFAERGYDGASIADITRASGLSSGAIYAHFGSKAELFAAVLEMQGEREFTRLVGGQEVDDVAELFRIVGSSFDRRRPSDVNLAIAAVVAARRDPEVTRRVSDWLAGDEALVVEAVQAAQDLGQIDRHLSAEAIGRFTTMLSLGAQLTRALDLPAVDHDHWSALIARLVRSAEPGADAGVDAHPDPVRDSA